MADTGSILVTGADGQLGAVGRTVTTLPEEALVVDEPTEADRERWFLIERPKASLKTLRHELMDPHRRRVPLLTEALG